MSYTPTYRAPKRNAHRSRTRGTRVRRGGPAGKSPAGRRMVTREMGGAGKTRVAILNERREHRESKLSFSLSLSHALSASGDLLIPFLPLARGSASHSRRVPRDLGTPAGSRNYSARFRTHADTRPRISQRTTRDACGFREDAASPRFVEDELFFRSVK